MSCLKTYDSIPSHGAPSKCFEIISGELGGKIDGKQALLQACYQMLSTNRFEHGIFTSDYGLELNDLLGKGKQEVLSFAESRIEEALEQDDRIVEILGIALAWEGDTLTAMVEVKSIFGDIALSQQIV